MSYSIFITVFIYFLPIFLFLYQNSIILYIVSWKEFIFIKFFIFINFKIKSPHLHKNATIDDIKEAEIEANRAFKSVFIICGCLTFWAPFTISSLQRYFYNSNELNIKVIIIPALIAKCTLAVPAISNLVGNQDIRGMLLTKKQKVIIVNRLFSFFKFFCFKTFFMDSGEKNNIFEEIELL